MNSFDFVIIFWLLHYSEPGIQLPEWGSFVIAVMVFLEMLGTSDRAYLKEILKRVTK